MFLLHPSTTFRQVQEDGELVQENPPGTNLVFLRSNLKGTDQKLKKSETRTCLVQMIKWKHQFQNFVQEEEIPFSGMIKWKRP